MTSRKQSFAVVVLLFVLCTFSFTQSKQNPKVGVPTPQQFLGFEVGADRTLADYHQITSYLKKLSETTPRVQVESLGKTTMGNDMVMAVISSADNLQNKEKYKKIAKQVADPRGLSKEQIEALANEGKAIALVTCNIHSTEIGSSQMAMEWAYALATGTDPETTRRLDNVIVLLVPSLNPDGQIMEVEWYRKYLGTKYEGGRSPFLYHKYVGHDDNRDWYMLTQAETKNVTRMVYKEWFPQLWLDLHQMGSTGPRIFVPPDADPIAPALSPVIFSGINLIGTEMMWRLDEAKKSGAIYNWAFDAYWPGGTRNTAWWKNIFGLLVEVASARMATPIEVAPTELTAGGKGLIEYGKQINYPNPWKGGLWRLRDIMDYDRIVSDAYLETAAEHRADFLRGTARLGMEAVAEGGKGEYYEIPMDGRQRDPNAAANLAQLMREHGADVFVDLNASFMIPLAQPYGKFVTEMMTTQRYPEVKPAPGKDILAPYDVTTWSLPLMMGVDVSRKKLADANGLKPATDADRPKGGVKGSGAVYVVGHEQNNVSRMVNAALKRKMNVSVAKAAFAADGVEYPAGAVLFDANGDAAKLAEQYHLSLTGLKAAPQVNSVKLKPVRVGLYKSYTASMDEGWTRWLLEQYEFEPVSIENKEMKAGKLNEKFDAIVLPDITKEVIVDGRPRRPESAMKYVVELPPEYTGGIGKEGVQALKEFVEKGGTIITIADSGEFLADNFNIPVRNVLANARAEEFLCPGSLLRVELDNTNPIAYGMPKEAAAFIDGNIAYQTQVPGPELQRAVVASYPTDARDILMSGWIRGEERLARRAAVVTFTVGKGKLVMFGFRPQYRAQTEGTFKLLFNAIHWAGMD